MPPDERPSDATPAATGVRAGARREAEITPADRVKVVPKPWGEERWLAHTDRYAGKLLILKKGHRLSLQYHEHKHETQYVDSGRIKYTLGSVDRPDEYEEFIAEAGTAVMLPPVRSTAWRRSKTRASSRCRRPSSPTSCV